MSDPAVINLGMTRAFALIGKQTVLVDTGYPGQTDRVLAALTQLGLGPKDIGLILITHGHLDHFGSAAGLKAALDAPVAVHAADAQALRLGTNPPVRPTSLKARLMKAVLGRLTAQAIEPLEPDIVFEQPPDLTPLGLDWRIIHTPGHTPGSVCLVQPGGAAVIGDLLMGALLRPSRPGRPLFADDLAANRRSLARLLAEKPTRLWPAHGGPFDPARAARL